MSRVFEFTGDAPQLVPPAPAAIEIIKIIQKQLELLDRLTQEKWIVAAGSGMREKDLK